MVCMLFNENQGEYMCRNYRKVPTIRTVSVGRMSSLPL
nr:MAG TPA: hypothetical protein [Caudoviricetes sp.]